MILLILFGFLIIYGSISGGKSRDEESGSSFLRQKRQPQTDYYYYYYYDYGDVTTTTTTKKPTTTTKKTTTTTTPATTRKASASDPWSIITRAGNDALYPEKFDVPLLDVSYPNLGYGPSRMISGFHFFDILGYKTTSTMPECLMLCHAHPPCQAMNWVAPLSRCVLLGSATNETIASRALWNDRNASSLHIYFTGGSKANPPSYQPQDPPAKLPFGVSAVAQSIRQMSRQRIIGGTEAVRNSYPWIVRVVSCPQVTTCNVCGGTILPPNADNRSPRTSSDIVLTAAHCVIVAGTQAQPQQMYLKLANHVDDVLERHEILMPVRRIITNRNYNANNRSEDDVTILQMQSPVTFTNYVNAVRLPTKDFPTNNNTCVAIGWGRFADNSSQSINLQQAMMPILSYSTCDNEWRGLNMEKTGRICASSASLNTKSSVCQILLIMWHDVQGIPLKGHFGDFIRNLSHLPKFVTKINMLGVISICQMVILTNNVMSEVQLCEAWFSLCINQGDSGGPILCQETVDNIRTLVIYGVTSQVDTQSCLRKPGIFMRSFYYMKWMTDVVRNINSYPDQQHIRV